MCVGTLATAVVASWVGVRTLRETAKGVRNSYRPLMVAELMPPDKPKLPAVLRVANDGNTVARDVVVAFNPPFQNPTRKGTKTESSTGCK